MGRGYSAGPAAWRVFPLVAAIGRARAWFEDCAAGTKSSHRV